MEKLVQQIREVEELFLQRPISFKFVVAFILENTPVHAIKTLNDETKFSATFNIENPFKKRLCSDPADCFSRGSC